LETLLRGPTQWCVEIFEGLHQGLLIEIDNVEKARAERMKPRPLQERLQWRVPQNPINQRIITFIKTSSLARYLSDQKGGMSLVLAERRGFECCASAYPELQSLQ